jgi:hypothetical protein
MLGKSLYATLGVPRVLYIHSFASLASFVTRITGAFFLSLASFATRRTLLVIRHRGSSVENR